MNKDIIKGIFLIIGFLSLFGIVFAVGFHTANEVLSGTFIGDYNFIGEVNFSNVNIGDGFSNTKIICPAGFTSIESQGRQLGCIQNDEEGSNTCIAAINTCWVNYGGRLPSYSEAYIAFVNYVLNNEGGEWVDGVYTTGTLNCGAISTFVSNFEPTGGLYTQSIPYRCFIPK